MRKRATDLASAVMAHRLNVYAIDNAAPVKKKGRVTVVRLDPVLAPCEIEWERFCAEMKGTR